MTAKERRADCPFIAAWLAVRLTDCIMSGGAKQTKTPHLLTEMRHYIMVQALERLEIPVSTYDVLARIAQSHGSTPLQLIEGWIEQHQRQETRQTLRQEYQQLIEKDLGDTLTLDEEKRLDVVCAELNALEAQSEGNAIWQQQAVAIDARLDQIQRLLAALPERRNL